MPQSILLTQGFYTTVDDEDYGWANQWKWHYGTKGYAIRRSSSNEAVFMHHEIAKRHGLVFDAGELDHRDGNGLNNQKGNFRSATNEQQQSNKKMRANNRSGYIGVHWRKDFKKWVAKIHHDGKYIHIGYFTDPILAAKAYDRMAYYYKKEFAVLNFPKEQT